MEYSDTLIPISHIRQFLFCPRIPWFKQVMLFEPPEQGWVSQGKRWHEEQSPRHKRRLNQYLQGPLEHATDVYVRSESLGVHGYIDELITNSTQCVVVEYKVDTHKPTLAQKLQLMAYSIAAGESLSLEVVAGVLLKGDARKQYPVELNQSLKMTLLKVLMDLRTVTGSHRMPISSATDAKCDQCEYLRYCNDR